MPRGNSTRKRLCAESILEKQENSLVSLRGKKKRKCWRWGQPHQKEGGLICRKKKFEKNHLYILTTLALGGEKRGRKVPRRGTQCS